MKRLPQLMRNKTSRMQKTDIYRKLKQAFLPLIFICIATFFIQAEDETVMYIALFFIVLIVGLVNLLRGLFSKHNKKGDGGHGHIGHEEHGRDEDAE